MNSSGSHKDLAAKYVKLNKRNNLHSTLIYAGSQMQKGHYGQLASNKKIVISSVKLGDANVVFSLPLRI